MPARSTLGGLPIDAQKRIEARMIAQNFREYTELAEWLSVEGYEISRSALHRHGQKLEKRIAQIDASTRAAAALMESNPDAESNLAAATLKAAQSRLFDLIMAADAEEVSVKDLAAALKAASEGARADVVIQRERKRVLAEVAIVVDEVEKRQGMSASGAAALREALAKV